MLEDNHDENMRGDFHAARESLRILMDADKDWGLGCEVLLAALDELDITPSKFYDAVCAGEAEWIK